jgi:ElaB/YqjD/DUF883 family membrane-anchored ribosome-binding protein
MTAINAKVGLSTEQKDAIRADIEHVREELGDTVEALAAKVDLKGRTLKAVDSTKDFVQEKAHTMQEQATDLMDQAKDSVHHMQEVAVAKGSRMGEIIRRHPVLAVAITAAVAIGLTALIIRRRSSH